MTTPAWAKDHCTRPEQSNEVGPAAPHTYGMPSLLAAASSMAVTWLVVSPVPETDAGAVPVASPAVPGLAVVDATSGSTSAPLGTTDLIFAISEATVACGALTTMALPAAK